MKVITKSRDLFYLILPFKIQDKLYDNVVNKVKTIFLNYNNQFKLLEPGFYEVSVYDNDIVGTILKVDKLESFSYSLEIDLRIVIKGKIKVYFKLIDPTEFIEYKDKVDIDKLSIREFLNLIEHCNYFIE